MLFANGPIGPHVTSSATHHESLTRQEKRHLRAGAESAKKMSMWLCQFPRWNSVTLTISAQVTFSHSKSTKKLFLDSFTYGPWRKTLYCNETCGDNRFFLESRTCSLVSPNLPDNFSCQDQTTLRTGTTMCPPSVFNCAGSVKQHD